MSVVMLDELGQHGLQVTPAKDEDAITNLTGVLGALSRPSFKLMLL